MEQTQPNESAAGLSALLQAARAYREKREAIRSQERAEAFEPVEKKLEAPSGWTQELVAEFLAFYDEQDAVLVAKGFHRTSRWWRGEIERFLTSGRKRWVIRVGRQGGKSSTLTRLYVAFARWKRWRESLDTLPEIPLLSQSIEKAAQRLYTIKAILDALGEPYEPRGNRVFLERARMEFKVVAATANAVGMTALGLFCDEVSRWPAGSEAAHPAKVVVGSASPAMVTQPLAFTVLASTPYGELDYHAELYDEGDNDDQVTSYAPTWVATDGFVTEAQTHERERDPVEWSINYLAVPQASLTSAFDKAQVGLAFKRTPKGRRGTIGWVACDPSSAMRDGYAYACGWATADGEVVVSEVFEWSPAETPPIEDICEVLKSKALEVGAGYVFGDHYEQKGMFDGLAKIGVAYQKFAWTLPSKENAFSLLRRKLREGRFCVLAEDPKLKHEMERCPAEIQKKTGRTRYETTGLDRLSCLVTLAHAVAEGYYRVSDGATIDWAMFEEMQAAAPGVFPG